jgi:DNA-directed RNA polymerase specialized sigma24 family protein
MSSHGDIAFEKLVRPHFDRLYRLAWRLAGLPGTQNPALDHERMEQMLRLDSALSKLSDEHRVVVLLHDTEGYKITKIQELTGIPVGTVKSRLHRARARLREILVEDGTFS